MTTQTTTITREELDALNEEYKKSLKLYTRGKMSLKDFNAIVDRLGRADAIYHNHPWMKGK